MDLCGENGDIAARGYMDLAPDTDKLPVAQFSMLSGMAAEEAQRKARWTEQDGPFSPKLESMSIISSMDLKKELEGESIFKNDYICAFLALSQAYFSTQFLYKGHISPLSVELHALKLALLRSQDTPLKNFISNKLVFVISFSAFISRLAIRGSNLPARHEVDPMDAFKEGPKCSALEQMLYRCTILGAVVWLLSDSVRNITTEDDLKLRVFVSYSSKDRAKARAIKKHLESAYFRVWMDEKDIPVGLAISRRISEAISSESDYLVLLMSEQSLSSEWVKFEIDQAHLREMQRGTTYLLPVLIDRCEIPASLKIKRYADGTKSTKLAAGEIASAIKWIEGGRN